MSSPAPLPPAILLMGPTAAGKTALAVALAQAGPYDLISVDSGMVYRGMDIGTAKPDAATLARAPHRLIDIRDPATPYSAAEFRRDALAEMAAITAAGRVPVLVGGTMLYYRVLLSGIADMPAADPAVRARIEELARAEGWPAVHARLAAVDPVSAARLGPNDSQRLSRALEVYEVSGRPLSAWHAEQAPPTPLPYRLAAFVVAPPDRALLHQRIADRVDAMLAAGFLDEVARLRARPDLHADLPALKSVGYAEAWAHLAGTISADDMRLRMIYATRQLAKRQYTWLRRFDAEWLDATAPGLTDTLLKKLEADRTFVLPRGV